MEFNNFIKLKDDFQKVEQNGTYKHFAADEFLRFISIGGTVLASFPDVQNCINQRMLSHIYLRSILKISFGSYIFLMEINKVIGKTGTKSIQIPSKKNM